MKLLGCFKVYILVELACLSIFGESGQGNKANSSEMSETAFKMFEERQDLWKNIILICSTSSLIKLSFIRCFQLE